MSKKKIINMNDSVEIELTELVSMEEIRSIWFDDTAIIESPTKIRRINAKGNRFYFTQDDQGDLSFYLSVTSAIQKAIPESFFLKDWKDKEAERIGVNQRKEYVQTRADYGTFLHICLADLMVNREFDPKELDEKLKTFMNGCKLDYNESVFREWRYEIKMDMLALAQWVIDYDVWPIAVEYPMADSETKLGGCMDLVVDMLAKKYAKPTKERFESLSAAQQAKHQNFKKWKSFEENKWNRVTAAGDLKSGRKGFFENHQIQVELYREMFNREMKELGLETEATHSFNLSPKEWRGSAPTYNFKWQQDFKTRWMLDVIKLWVKNYEFSNLGNVIEFTGPIKLNVELWKSYTKIDLREKIRQYGKAEVESK